MTAGASDALEWKFVQSFGDDNSSDDDLVTTVEFDETGDYLAVGDKAGRICIFDCHTSPPPFPSYLPNVRPPPPSFYLPQEYRFYTEFQSHEPEFDCLKSLEIEEKINCIRWCKRQSTGLFLLATNDKTIKYWKVHDKKIKAGKDALTGRRAGAFITPTLGNGITVPRLMHSQTITTATPKRIYANAHGYHINSLSINSDQQTFLSADDLRINLWDFTVNNESFNIVDIKPNNLEELTEVITAATFHPSHCNLLLYASSRGSLRLVDLRDNALHDSHAKLLDAEEDVANKSFFSEIIASISDCKFASSDGRYVVSRDYLTVKVWDVHMESKPINVIPVHDYLKLHLCDLYENDCIFDKFQLSLNQDATQAITGSYNNHFVLFDIHGNDHITIEALKDGPRRTGMKEINKMGKGKVGGKEGKGGGGGGGGGEVFDVNKMDFGKKALHVAWHPKGNTVAVAGLNKLYVHQAMQSTGEGGAGTGGAGGGGEDRAIKL